MLVYNPHRDAYEGRRVSVPRWLWDEAVAELIESGVSDGEARRRLLDEAEWLDVEGTEVLPLCLNCRRPLPPGRQFCDVVCEAAFIAEAHG